LPAGPPAAYLPISAVEKQAGDAGARKQFGAAYEQMIKGGCRLIAREAASRAA